MQILLVSGAGFCRGAVLERTTFKCYVSFNCIAVHCLEFWYALNFVYFILLLIWANGQHMWHIKPC